MHQPQKTHPSSALLRNQGNITEEKIKTASARRFVDSRPFRVLYLEHSPALTNASSRDLSIAPEATLQPQGRILDSRRFQESFHLELTGDLEILEISFATTFEDAVEFSLLNIESRCTQS